MKEPCFLIDCGIFPLTPWTSSTTNTSLQQFYYSTFVTHKSMDKITKLIKYRRSRKPYRVGDT